MFPLAHPSRRRLLTLAGLAAGAAALAACGEDGSAAGTRGGGLTVVTSNYPLSYVVSRVGGDRVSIADLATPGADAHGLELSIKQAIEVQEAALVLQIPRYQASLDDAISSGPADNVLDVSSIIELLPADVHSHDEHSHDEHSHDEHAHVSDGGEHADEAGDQAHAGQEQAGHDHGPDDPHFWHDPLRLAQVADALAVRLGQIDPEGAETFTAAAAEVRSDLEALDAELREVFDPVEGDRTFITSHAAYAYLAARYDLHQVGIAGIDPETEPSPRRLLELEQVIDEENVTTIFFETTASPKVARTLAENVGVDSAELDNLETQLDEDADYPSVMRSNCRKLLESWS